MTPSELHVIQERLAEPMPFQVIPLEVRTFDRRDNGRITKAQAAGYLDRDDVLSRLDEVLGLGNWQSRFVVVAPGVVECQIGLRVGDDFIWRADAGAADGSRPEDLKSAYTDALKRAATQWGIGRFLYRLPRAWASCEASQAGDKLKFRRWIEDPVQVLLQAAEREGGDAAGWVKRFSRKDGRWEVQESEAGYPESVSHPKALPPAQGEPAASPPSLPPASPAPPGSLPSLEAALAETGRTKREAADLCKEMFGHVYPQRLNALEYEQFITALRSSRRAA